MTTRSLLTGGGEENFRWVQYWIMYSLTFSLEIIINLEQLNIPSYYKAKLLLLGLCISSIEKQNIICIKDQIMRVIMIFHINNQNYFVYSKILSARYDHWSAQDPINRSQKREESRILLNNMYLRDYHDTIRYENIKLKKSLKRAYIEIINLKKENNMVRKKENKPNDHHIKNIVPGEEKQRGNYFQYAESNKTQFIIKQIFISQRESIYKIHFHNFKQQEISLLQIFIYIVRYWMLKIT